MTEFLTFLFVGSFLLIIVVFLVMMAVGAVGAAFALTAAAIDPDTYRDQ